MTPERIVVVGASIAGVTAASELRVAGWTGRLTVVSDEAAPPYSRVPLSKGVLAGTHAVETAALAALPDDIELRLGVSATALRLEQRLVELSDGSALPWDGLVIATGARARRIAADGQRGELVVRTLGDAAAIAARAATASSAIVVGGGFLGVEVASTLRGLGLDVVLVARERPLLRLLGRWLADLVAEAGAAAGVRFVVAPDGVALLGDPVTGVRLDDGGTLTADLVVSAAGDLPNIEWAEGSGLEIDGGIVVDDRCRAAPDVVAAGDVVALRTPEGDARRTPHWTNAVGQGRAAASALLDPAAPAFLADHYFWTEEFGLDVKIAGRLPLVGEPEVVRGSLDDRSALLTWRGDGGVVAAVALNHRIPVARLKAMVTA